MAEGTRTKFERNEKIFVLKQDQGLNTTFETLAVMFNLSVWRVKEIYYKECKKRGIKVRGYKKSIK